MLVGFNLGSNLSQCQKDKKSFIVLLPLRGDEPEVKRIHYLHYDTSLNAMLCFYLILRDA